MKTSVVTIDGVSFLEIELVRIEQKGEYFYTGIINAPDLFRVYTVEPAEYDLAKLIGESLGSEDDADYLRHIIAQKKEQAENKKFQRSADKTQLNSIEAYINKKRHAFFPNSIIATCETSSGTFDSSNIDEYVAYTRENTSSTQCLFIESPPNAPQSPTTHKLLMPLRRASLLVIDGQHRIRGLEQAQGALSGRYELLISFIINYDRSVVAEQFYTINFTPRKVNKSVLLHLMGDFETGNPNLVFLHEVARVFNEFHRSPFCRRLKMLGKTDADISPEQRRLQTISQAFFIKCLEPSVAHTASKSVFQPIFLFHFHKGFEGRLAIQSFLLQYYTAISNLRSNDWNSPDSMICKSVGFGAITNIMYFYFVIRQCQAGMDPEWMTRITTQDIMQDLGDLSTISLDQFRGLSSASVLSKIKEHLVENINFFGATNYRAFLAHYRKEHLENYTTWIQEKVFRQIEQEKSQQHSLFPSDS